MSDTDCDAQPPHLYAANASKTALNDCLNFWLFYLQTLNGLCMTGARVALGVRNSFQRAASDHMGPAHADWEEVSRILLTLTTTARSQSMTLLQRLESSRSDHKLMDDTFQQLIFDNILSFIDMSYGFCFASNERLAALNANPCWKMGANDLLEHETTFLTPRMSCFSPSFPCLTEDSVSLLPSPHLFSLNAEICRTSLESPTKLDFGRLLHPSCDNCVYGANHDRTIEGMRISRRDFRNLSNFDRTQLSQGSSSSSDGLQQSFLNPESLRIFQHSGNIVGSGPLSPLGCETIKRPMRGLPDSGSLRGPFPAPGMLASTKGPFIKPPRIGPHAYTPGPVYSYTMPTPFSKLQSAQQRRWSEAAAHEMCEREDDGANARRWSVPWDGGPPPPQPSHQSTQSESWKDNYGSSGSAWDSIWGGDQDPLAAAILLLSCRPPVINKEQNGLNPERNHGWQRTAGEPKGYSIWSGNDALPFLRLPESLERSDENLYTPNNT